MTVKHRGYQWKDTSSYDQSLRIRIPNQWMLQITADVRLHLYYDKEAYHITCIPWFNYVRLERQFNTLGKAQAEAIERITDTLKQAVEAAELIKSYN